MRGGGDVPAGGGPLEIMKVEAPCIDGSNDFNMSTAAKNTRFNIRIYYDGVVENVPNLTHPITSSKAGFLNGQIIHFTITGNGGNVFGYCLNPGAHESNRTFTIGNKIINFALDYSSIYGMIYENLDDDSKPKITLEEAKELASAGNKIGSYFIINGIIDSSKNIF